MNISEQEHMAVTDDIMAALDKNGVDDATKKDRARRGGGRTRGAVASGAPSA